jgi:hypothetical protein
MPYPKVSADQIDQQIHAFEQTPAAQSVEQQQQTQAGISPVNRGAPAKPVDGPAKPPEQAASAGAFPAAPKPDLQTMAKDVAAAQTTLNQNAPGPQIPWESALKLGGTTAAAVAAAHYLFGGEKDAGGDGKSGRVSVKDMPKEPEMNKVHNSLQDLMAAKDEGLLASQRAEQAATQLAQETPQAVSAQAKPLTDVAIDEEIGKPLPKEDIKLVAQGEANKESKSAAAEVKAGEKKITGAAEPTKYVPPISSDPNETKLTKGQQGAKGWLEGQWGKGSNYYQAVQDIFGGKPPTYTSEKGQHAIGPEAHNQVLDWRKENVSGPKVNLTKELKTAIQELPKSGDARVKAIAALMALPAFANAAEGGKEKDLQKTWGSAVQGITSFLGPLGMIAGDIYGISPEDLEKVRKQERDKKQAATVGSSRGIAPPSSYQK